MSGLLKHCELARNYSATDYRKKNRWQKNASVDKLVTLENRLQS